ncbi:MAG: uracil-DNA glycosylase family protein [Pseudomonadota bacterium]
MSDLRDAIGSCTICAARFGATQTRHAPRPVVWFGTSPRILIAGQAPGLRVHQSGTPFLDRSGDRLRNWMGVDPDTFYDRTRISIVPMAFCFPGYRKGTDLPPPKICAKTWRDRVLAAMGPADLTLLIGGAAMEWHLGGKATVRARVSAWADTAPSVFALPHPSWRNNAWLKKNPWFEAEVLPVLQARVKEVLQ